MVAHSTDHRLARGFAANWPPLRTSPRPAHAVGCDAACASVARAPLARAVVEFALPHAVEEAHPLVPVIDKHPAGLVAGHAHQHPVAAGPDGVTDEGNLDGPVALAGSLPGLRGDVDAQRLYRRLRHHDAPVC